MLVVSPGLMVTVDATGLRIEHPAWDYGLTASPGVVELLRHARVPVSREELTGVLRTTMHEPRPDDVLRRLLRAGLFQEVDGASSVGRPPVPWNYWGTKTWWFHAYAHRTTFLRDESDIWFEKASREEPAPCRSARYAARDDDVGLSGFRGGGAVADLFARRRTARDFTGEPLALDVLGELVSETFRVRGVHDADFFGSVPSKSYPSSGGRHEIDTYVAAREVTELPAGVFYYDDHRDTLVPTGLGVSPEQLDDCLAGQGIATSSAALLITVCHAERLAWKYRSPRGYLDAYINVGHALQNAILYAASLGVGTWPTTAIDTPNLASLLRLGPAEFPTAVLGLGHTPG